MILLYHENEESSTIILHEKVIAGVYSPKRIYKCNNHFVELKGLNKIIQHDYEEMKELGYRLASAKEQEQYIKKKIKESIIEEFEGVGRD